VSYQRCPELLLSVQLNPAAQDLVQIVIGAILCTWKSAIRMRNFFLELGTFPKFPQQQWLQHSLRERFSLTGEDIIPVVQEFLKFVTHKVNSKDVFHREN
jgi:hypothetical protein